MSTLRTWCGAKAGVARVESAHRTVRIYAQARRRDQNHSLEVGSVTEKTDNAGRGEPSRRDENSRPIRRVFFGTIESPGDHVKTPPFLSSWLTCVFSDLGGPPNAVATSAWVSLERVTWGEDVSTWSSALLGMGMWAGRSHHPAYSDSKFLRWPNAMFSVLRGSLPEVRQPLAFLTGWIGAGRADAERSIMSFLFLECEPCTGVLICKTRCLPFYPPSSIDS